MRLDVRRDGSAVALALLVGVLLATLVPDVRLGPGVTFDDPTLPVTLAVHALACVGVVFRRTRPTTAFLVTFGVVVAALVWHGSVNLGTAIVFVDLMMIVVTRGPARVAQVVSAAGLIVILVGTTAAFAALGVREGLLALLNLMLLFGLPLGWANEVRQHRTTAEEEHDRAEAERERAEQAERMAELSRRAAVAEERARMARDLHDVIAGHLSAIALQSEAVLSLAADDPVTTRRVLESVRRNSVASLAEMRTMIELLRSSDGSDTSADPATAPARLGQVCELVDSARASGLTVDADVRAPHGEVVAAVDLAAFRIVQESLTNAAKHAPGSTVRLSVRHDDGSLVIDVTNTPGGAAVPDVAAGAGAGLLGLRERAHAVGGTVDAGPRAGGWRVLATLPVGGREHGRDAGDRVPDSARAGGRS